MNREYVVNSIALKKRFCKDCGLPISVYDNPYFMERLKTIDPLFKCIKSFKLFCNELERFKDEQEYFEYYNKIKDDAINAIKGTDEFAKFNSMTIGACSPVARNVNLYSNDNNNKTFISIDMKKANFSAMHHYSPNIFGCAATWEEFISMFTHSKHIANSKYVRQVICGACNPRRQVTYEHFLMCKLAEHLVDNIKVIDIYSICSDEIIISVPQDGCGFSMNELRSVISGCPDGIGKIVKVELFDLINVKHGWIKQLSGGDVQFKCVDSEIYHQLVKHFYGKKITKHDLVFYHNGQLAQFLKEIDNPWNESGCLKA